MTQAAYALTDPFDQEDLGEEPSAYKLPFVKAGPNVCRYIIGNPSENAICCGAPTDGGSWCSWHRRIVFEPRKPRVR